MEKIKNNEIKIEIEIGPYLAQSIRDLLRKGCQHCPAYEIKRAFKIDWSSAIEKQINK